jgi:CDP-diacylglycerol--glycerol-3-phosphate 3-phosphatidyltransferase
VFTIASITDFFDGVIARNRNQMTDFVKIMDPLADKILITAALIALVQTHEIAAWFAIMIVARDLLITGFRLLLASKNIVAGAVITGKINTFFQMFLIILVLAGMTGIMIDVFIYMIVILTIVSTAENFVRNIIFFTKVTK